MKSFSKRLYTIIVSVFILSLFVGMTCCTNVDDRLGLKFIPGDQQMGIRRDTFGIDVSQMVRTYTEIHDSLATNSIDVAFFGKASDQTFGKSRAASIVQMLPYTIADLYGDEDSGSFYFNEKRISDSLMLYVAPVYLTGDSTREQTFMVYAITDTLSIDSTYYQFIDYSPIKDPDPLFSFNLKGSYSSSELITLDPTVKGMKYMQDLIEDTTIYYTNREQFRKDFKGFIIEPKEDSPEDAAVYGINLNSAYFILYYHTYESETASEVADTLGIRYYTADFGKDVDGYSANVSIIKLDHDYSGTPVEAALTLTENQTPQAVSYVHGLAGVTTRLEFPDEFFEAILEKKESAAADMMLNQAMIYIQLEDDDTEVMDASHNKFGSYYDFQKAVLIPDYSVNDEQGIEEGGNYSSYYYTYYNGKLNRTFGYYNMDITTFIHYALKEYNKKKNGETYDEDFMKYSIGPVSYPNHRIVNGNGTAVKGYGSDTPVKVRLTYTLIKK